jgi:hypothetical protein
MLDEVLRWLPFDNDTLTACHLDSCMHGLSMEERKQWEEMHERLKAELDQQCNFDEPPKGFEYLWEEAAARKVKESKDRADLLAKKSKTKVTVAAEEGTVYRRRKKGKRRK